jgi:hypothetical protein
MKPSILVVMLDFLVCSLLLFIIGTGGKQTQFATSAPPVHEEFSPAAIQAQQEEWNRDYEQQTLLTRLNAETAEKEQLRTRLNETSASLATREANLKSLSEEKTRVEQAKSQTEQALSNVQTQLGRVNAEREKLQQEGEAAKESLIKLEQQKTELEQHAKQLGQTVASQQATISTLSEEVRASQVKVEAQLTDVARGQQEMGTTLAQLDEFTRTLPATIQKNVAGIGEQQQAMQQNVAALTETVKGLQTGLSVEENARLMQAVADVAKGQQELQSQLGGLIKAGQGEIGQSLNTIQAGQEALRQQTSRLGEQVEAIKARGPGPYQAVKGARLELLVAIATRDTREGVTSHFKSAAYPPVVSVDGHSFVVANDQTLGLAWWALRSGSPQNEITELKYTIGRGGDTPWSGPLTSPACALRADPRVVSVELDRPVPGLNTMQLAAPEAILQSDQRKLHVFKSTAAGLSFEADASPDLSDARYLVVKRPVRGVAAWFENPAYRADTGDYMVTADGKLVGIMVNREKCFILSKENLLNCASTVPLVDKQEFQRAVRQLPRVK